MRVPLDHGEAGDRLADGDALSEPPERLYAGRKLGEGFPDLESRGASFFVDHQSTQSEAPQVMTYIGRLMRLPADAHIVVVGCGPKPETVAKLAAMGHRVTGVEPIASHVDSANRWLEGRGRVICGTAEDMGLPDGEACDVIISESVLEHVDSPKLALEEAHRRLAPGGVLYLGTTNRHRVSLTGANGEFTAPFFNWFPRVVKESYVHRHLHFDPRLANWSPRPAVHWFTYADLCARGREAGFCRFYSKVDLMEPGDPAASSWLRRALLRSMKYRPWIRALALVQYGASIFMVKRGRLRE